MTAAGTALHSWRAPAFAAKAPPTQAALEHYRPYVAQVLRDIRLLDKEAFARIVQHAPGPGVTDILYECYMSIVAGVAPPLSISTALLRFIPNMAGGGTGNMMYAAVPRGLRPLMLSNLGNKVVTCAVEHSLAAVAEDVVHPMQRGLMRRRRRAGPRAGGSVQQRRGVGLDVPPGSRGASRRPAGRGGELRSDPHVAHA